MWSLRRYDDAAHLAGLPASHGCCDAPAMTAVPLTRVIVVGAGSAGAVVAARSQRAPGVRRHPARGRSRRTVGRHATVVRAARRSSRPSTSQAAPGHDLMATRSGGQAPRPYVRGRGVGGSSAINAMVALPGEPGDYDEWEHQSDAPDGRGQHVAPWFHRTRLQLHRAEPAEWGVVNRALGVAVDEAATGVPLTRDAVGQPLLGERRVPRAGSRARRPAGEGRHPGRPSAVRRPAGGGCRARSRVARSRPTWWWSAPARSTRRRSCCARASTRRVWGRTCTTTRRSRSRSSCTSRRVAGRLPIATLAQLSSPGSHHDLQLLPIDGVDRTMPHARPADGCADAQSRSRGSVRLASRRPDGRPRRRLRDARRRARLATAVGSHRRCRTSARAPGHAGRRRRRRLRQVARRR